MFFNQTDVSLSRGRVTRRSMLKAVSAASLATGALSWNDAVSLQADELRKQGMACILLWMQGGPSQFDTFSPKQHHRNGGGVKAISTSAPGVQIAETLPETAKVMQHVCVIRSMNSKEGSHPRASYLMHTGYIPTASVKHPVIGSHVAQQLGDPAAELPNFVRISQGRGATGGGLLGVDYDPFVVADANRKPDNTTPASTISRYKRRMGLLTDLEQHFAENGGKQESGDHLKLYNKASKMILSPQMKAFDLAQEPQKARDAYGPGKFAAGCVMARRLVEAGVTFVEVGHGNWDTHDDNIARTKELCGQMDRAYAALLTDLQQRGMLEKTLVIWMGEFGRTPNMNGRGGRDHYPRAYNVALAGGGVKGGQVIGATNASGTTITDRPVGTGDLLSTCYHALKIDPNHENLSPIGRPIKIVEEGQVVKEALG